jgi:hypothetical protein
MISPEAEAAKVNGHAARPERARLNKEFNTAAALYLKSK